MSVLPFGAHRAYALAPLMGPMNERAVLVRGDVEATMRPEPCLDPGAVVVRRAGEELMLERLDYLKDPDALLHRLNHIDGIFLFGIIEKLLWRLPSLGGSGKRGSLRDGRRNALPRCGVPE